MKYLQKLSTASIAGFFLIFPLVSFAQTTSDSLQGFIWAIGSFINTVLIPFVFALALLTFLFNVGRYYILDGDKEESRAKAKQTAIYAIIGFVFLVSIWGIVNMLVSSLNLGRNSAVVPDYIEYNQQSTFGNSWYNPFSSGETFIIEYQDNSNQNTFGNVPIPTRRPTDNDPLMVAP